MIDLLSVSGVESYENLFNNANNLLINIHPTLLKHNIHQYFVALLWLLFIQTKIRKHIERHSYEFALLEYQLSMQKLSNEKELPIDTQYIGLTTYYSNFQ